MRGTAIGTTVRVNDEQVGKIAERYERQGALLFDVRTGTGLLTELPAARLSRRCPKRSCDNGAYMTATGPGHCFWCHGQGWVPLVEAQREYDRVWDRRMGGRKSLWDTVRGRTGSRASQLEYDLREAIGLLEQEDTKRVQKMDDSLAAGRIDDVITCLLTYLRQHRR